MCSSDSNSLRQPQWAFLGVRKLFFASKSPPLYETPPPTRFYFREQQKGSLLVLQDVLSPILHRPVFSLSRLSSLGGAQTGFPTSLIALGIKTLSGSFLLALFHFPESPKDGHPWPPQCPRMKCIRAGSSNELKQLLATLPDGEPDGSARLRGSTCFSAPFSSSMRQRDASSPQGHLEKVI